MHSCTEGVAVAVTAMMGTLGKLVLKLPSSRYAGLQNEIP